MSVRLNDTEWLRRQLGPDEYSGDTDAGEEPEPAEPTADGPESGQDGVRPAGRERKSVVWFGGLAAVGIVITVLGAMLLYGGGKPAGQPGNDGTQPAPVTTVAPTPVAAEAAGPDRPLRFTASSPCPAGSTSAQTLDGTDPTNAFVCVRDGVDGQVIHLDLSKSYVITAVSLTPGWVGKDSSGVSQWEQHRVVTRVQYAFNDTDHTMITQDTGNVHGEAVQPVKHVLASKVTVLILQTSRPPAETTAPVPTPGLDPQGVQLLPPGGGLFSGPSTTPTSLPELAPMPGMGGQTTTDPVDHTFAISRLKIIGHEAI